MQTISLNGIYREFGIAHEKSRKLLAGMRPIKIERGYPQYSRSAVLKIIEADAEKSTAPPDDCLTVNALHYETGISASTIRKAISQNNIQPAGQYTGTNGNAVLYYHSKQVMDALQRDYQRNHITPYARDMPFGTLPKSIRSSIKTLQHAFQIANGRPA